MKILIQFSISIYKPQILWYHIHNHKRILPPIYR